MAFASRIKLRGIDDRTPCGNKRNADGCRLFEAQVTWFGRNGFLGHHDIFSLCAIARGAKTRAAAPDLLAFIFLPCNHNSREITARSSRQSCRPEITGHVFYVARIYCRRLDLNECFSTVRLGPQNFFNRENRRRTKFVKSQRLHVLVGLLP